MKPWIAALLVAGCSARTAAESTPAPPAPAPTGEVIPATTVAEASTEEVPEEHVLATFTTRFKAGPKMDGRVQNITLVASKLQNLRLAPGETFSFNRVVGPRTEELGFKNAPTIFMGETFEDIGGGTCQVSSTLYATALYAGLNVTDRRPHSRPSTYIEPGLDATVSYPAECDKKLDPAVCYDLKLVNNYDFPIRIQTEIGSELDKDEKRPLTISLLGAGTGPKVETRWGSWNAPAFEKRYRRVSYWKNDRKRLKQAGQPGLEGARYLTLTWPDGRVEKHEVISKYKPVPEVWEVGMEWKAEP